MLGAGNGDKHQISPLAHCKTQQFNSDDSKMKQLYPETNNLKQQHQKMLCRCCSCATNISHGGMRHCVGEINEGNEERGWSVTFFLVPEPPGSVLEFYLSGIPH